MLRLIVSAARAVLILAGLLLASCGRSQGAATAPCSLLTTQDVASAVGSPITTAQPQTDNPKYTICDYYTPEQNAPTRKPFVVLQINTQPVSAAAFKQSFATAKVALEPIEGLGDAAFYAAADNASDGTLFVIKGNQLFSIAIMDSPQDRATTRRTLQALAQLALSRYR